MKRLVSCFGSDAIIFLPSKIFDIYSDDYIYRVKEEYKNDKKETIKVIEMTPVNKKMDIFKIVVYINVDKMELTKSQIFEKSGMRYLYDIIKLDTSVKLEDSFFTFDPAKYKIAKEDITDLR